MNCEHVRTLLEGELHDPAFGSPAMSSAESSDPAVNAELAAHLQSCPECAACAARIPAENEAFADLLHLTNDEASWQRVKARVAERMAGSRRLQARPSEALSRRVQRVETRMNWSVRWWQPWRCCSWPD